MKKLFTLIAMFSFSAITMSAQSYLNYLYLQEGTSVNIGNDQEIVLCVHQTGKLQTIGIQPAGEFTFPKGVTYVDGEAIEDLYPKNARNKSLADASYSTSSGFMYSLTQAGGNTAKEQGLSTALTGSGPIFRFYVNVTSEAEAQSYITVRLLENSFTSTAVAGEDYIDEGHGYELVQELKLPFTVVGGATAISNVAEDGTAAAAPAKKIVDGQLVIETANGTFNAAGAQVK
ncbi:MAG: hypothetical protein J5932_03980 [Prevotella sp.]|nr:hypothetical protein [Prevotella sp.]